MMKSEQLGLNTSVKVLPVSSPVHACLSGILSFIDAHDVNVIIISVKNIFLIIFLPFFC